jgi:hypothetical protein
MTMLPCKPDLQKPDPSLHWTSSLRCDRRLRLISGEEERPSTKPPFWRTENLFASSAICVYRLFPTFLIGSVGDFRNAPVTKPDGKFFGFLKGVFINRGSKSVSWWEHFWSHLIALNVWVIRTYEISSGFNFWTRVLGLELPGYANVIKNLNLLIKMVPFFLFL